MNTVNYRVGQRVIVSTIGLSCALLASLMIRAGVSKGLAGNKPSVELQLSKTSISLPCPPGARSISRSCPVSWEVQIPMMAVASGFAKDVSYSYSVGGGKIVGEGSKVVWDLTGTGPGFYVIKVDVLDSKKRHATSSTTVTIANCGDCVFDEPCMFTLQVSCYEKVTAGTPITCKLTTSLRPDPDTHPRYTYVWTAHDSDGHDLTATITQLGDYVSIPTKDLGIKRVTTTVEVKEVDPSCNRTASGVTIVKP